MVHSEHFACFISFIPLQLVVCYSCSEIKKLRYKQFKNFAEGHKAYGCDRAEFLPRQCLKVCTLNSSAVSSLYLAIDSTGGLFCT